MTSSAGLETSACQLLTVRVQAGMMGAQKTGWMGEPAPRRSRHCHSRTRVRAITARTRRFHDGKSRSRSPAGQSKTSHRPRATPGDLLAPNSQWTTMRSTCGHRRINRRISPACSSAKRTSSSAGSATMSLKVSRSTAAKARESLAGAAPGSLIETQTSTPRGTYASAASRESTRYSMRCFMRDTGLTLRSQSRSGHQLRETPRWRS